MTASLLRAFVLSLSCGLALSCGDDGDGRASYENSCDAACARAHSCESDVDVEACASDCKRDAADVGPRLSSAFLGELDACVAAANCVQLALMPAAQACQREAAAQLAPSAAARELCDAVVASLQMCLGLSVGTAGCLDTVKIFSDSALVAARACDEMSCDQRSACLSGELGTDPSAMQ
ncbi:MAG TPA: hypothetical protein VK509_16505 [Polyangiales bacterium]|nr:hypothetical protein [Polyangiales bacterium]